MIYIKCTTRQMRTISSKRARVTVAIDQKTINYIKQHPQKLSLMEVAGNGWHGRKIPLVNYEIDWIESVDGIERSRLIAYRQLTPQEEIARDIEEKLKKEKAEKKKAKALKKLERLKNKKVKKVKKVRATKR